MNPPPELFLNGHSADSRVEWMMSGLRGEGTAEMRPTVMIAEDDREIRAGMTRALRDEHRPRVARRADPPGEP
jgi:hypothetical protein